MPPKKILLVDDVRLSIEMEKATLLRTNCKILTASNGKEALDIVNAEKPDLVLMDLYMPEMNGDDCCKAIKADPRLSKIPVIMCSTAGSEKDKKVCLDAGCDDFIAKPFKGVELLRKVELYVDIIVREHIRMPVNTKVTYIVDEVQYEGQAHDIGEGGMFIENKTSVPVGTIITIKFYLPNCTDLIEAEGEVVRIVKEPDKYRSDIVPGMGVRFIRVSIEGGEAINSYVHY